MYRHRFRPSLPADMMAVPDSPGVVAPPPLVYLVCLAGGFGLDALLPSASLPDALEAWLGWTLVIAGLGLLGSFVAAFGRARTPVDVSQAATTLVTTGPYRLTRNPAYLGMTLVYVGIGVLSEALWTFVPLVIALAVVDRWVIAREERYLERRFGEEYLEYKMRVRRWL